MIMATKRKVFNSIIFIIITIILGFGSRYFALYLPRWVNLYVGDFLWALMIFFMVGLIFKSKNTMFVALVALSFCYFIEISQLYHSFWIDNLRNSAIGRLILGRGFLWSDLISYSIGIGVGNVFDKLSSWG